MVGIMMGKLCFVLLLLGVNIIFTILSIDCNERKERTLYIAISFSTFALLSSLSLVMILLDKI